MRTIILISIISFVLNIQAQTSDYLLPSDYISEMNIKRILEVDLSDTSTRHILDFYEHGLLRQRVNFINKNIFPENNLDPNFVGKYVAFYETYTYDTSRNIEIKASSWSGNKDNYILISKYEMVKPDTFLVYDYGFTEIPDTRIETRFSEINTIQITDNNYAYLTTTGDTIPFKEIFKTPFGDSIIHFHQFDQITDIITKYLVYNGDSLVSAGTFSSTKEASIWSHTRMLFNTSGYPTEIITYDEYGKEIKKQELIIETF